MSRVQAIGLGLVLLCGMTWFAVFVDALPLARLINAGVEASADGTGDNFAAAIGNTFFYLVAAGLVGAGVGALLRGHSARAHEAELQRHLFDTKGRIPLLETGIRNRELQVARVELEMKELGERMLPLHRTIDAGEYDLRERDRTIAALRHELSELKAAGPISDAGAAGFMDLDFGDYRDALNAGDTKQEVLEAPRLDSEAEISTREARIGELLNEQRNHAERIVELAAARNQLLAEVSDRERRLVESRFECATARTTIAHLRAQLERSNAGGDS